MGWDGGIEEGTRGKGNMEGHSWYNGMGRLPRKGCSLEKKLYKQQRKVAGGGGEGGEV